MTPDVISTSLAHVAHILVLASHYLAIRLPAEITLPHSDYPRPTIFTVASSYQHDEVTFPEESILSQVPSDVGTRDPHQRPPRPRPLFLDKPMTTLAREDPAAYSLFLEGVTLLAYNIAWACCAQGVSLGDRNSYEDICNIGQNLWRLLIGDQLHRKSVEPAFPASLTPPASSPKDEGPAEIGKNRTRIGRWSHGAAHSYLGGAEGTEFVRSFKLLSPTKLVDRLKKKLSSEAPMLEWEKIDGDEVRAVEGGLEGVFVGHRRVRGTGRRDSTAGSRSTIRTGDGDSAPGGDGTTGTSTRANARPEGEDGGGVAERDKTNPGASGWTKVKNRQG